MDCDVVILIESANPFEDTLHRLQAEVSSSFQYPRCGEGRFQLFSRNLVIKEIYHGNRVSLRGFSYGGEEMILGLVHVVDAWNWDEPNQLVQVGLLAEDVRRVERKKGHGRTILIGDFNMNPFAVAMNMAPGMNAMMTENCTRNQSRTLQGEEYPFFYNPMWNLFGDRTPGPSGTYYHSNSSKGHFGWNMLDQVLLRPAAVSWFQDVQILTKAGEKPLHTESGRPDRNNASDHFPILLTLK